MGNTNLGAADKKKLYVLLFVARFALLAIPLLFVIDSGETSIAPVQEAEAAQVSSALKALGIDNERAKITGFPILVVDGLDSPVGFDPACTGWRSAWVCSSLVIALPGIKWMKKIKGILLGVLVIYAVNLVRIITIILLGINYGSEVFDFTHLFLWREGLMLAVIAYWALWMKKEKVLDDIKEVIKNYPAKKIITLAAKP